MWALQDRREAETPESHLSRFDQQMADPGNRDWRLLYRGSVLDD
jgi:hypothetical protein